MAVEECEYLIRRGYPKYYILKKLNKYMIDIAEAYEIARCRIKIKNKFSIHNLYFDEYGLRYSTPEIIGRYRAQRIRELRIADVSCGVGMQAIFFSFTNEKVLGIDIDARRIKYARLNAKAYGRENVKFIQGNCFSSKILEIAKSYDIIFSDPARRESEKERRLETLMPPPLKIMEKYGEKDYIFDLPPQISRNKLPKNWEKEYISVDGKIKRLTAYVGSVKKCNRRAVTLPSGEALCENDEDDDFTLTNELSNYIYLVDESIYYASLLSSLQKKFDIEYLQVGKRRTLATSSRKFKSGFLRKYEILCEGKDLDDIIHCLRSLGIGKVTLMLSLHPREYWKIRKKIEEKLKGDDKATLFKINDIFVAGKNVT